MHTVCSDILERRYRLDVDWLCQCVHIYMLLRGILRKRKYPCWKGKVWILAAKIQIERSESAQTHMVNEGQPYTLAANTPWRVWLLTCAPILRYSEKKNTIHTVVVVIVAVVLFIHIVCKNIQIGSEWVVSATNHIGVQHTLSTWIWKQQYVPCMKSSTPCVHSLHNKHTNAKK